MKTKDQLQQAEACPTPLERGAAKPLFLVLIIVLALAALLVAANLLFAAPQAPEAAQAASSMTVQLIHPLDDSLWPANTQVPVRAAVYSTRPLAKVELIVNDAVVATLYATSLQANPEWLWVPGASGYFILKVRATDASGEVQESLAAMVAASAPAAPVIAVTPRAGETIGSIAAEYGVSPEEIVAANPEPVYGPPSGSPPQPTPSGVQATPDPGQPPQGSAPADPPDPSQPILPGVIIKIPLKPVWPADPGIIVAPLATLPVQIELPGLPDGSDEPEDEPDPQFPDPQEPTEDPALPQGDPALVPAAPGMTASVWFCSASITLTDTANNADGFYIYRSSPAEPNFQRIGETNKPSTFYQDQPLWGAATYYATAYNASGESAASPQVSIDVTDPLCIKKTSLNPIGIQVNDNGTLEIPTYITLAYAYLNIDNSADWQRIPPGPQSFFPPGTTTFDPGPWVGSYAWLDENDNIKAYFYYTAHLWGWYGGKLYDLGEHKSFYGLSVLKICDRFTTGAQACDSYEDSALVDEASVAVDSASIPRELYFAANNWPDKVQGAVVQVSNQPFPEEPGFFPPGLAWSYFINGTKDNQSMGGSFSLDLYNLKNNSGLIDHTSYYGNKGDAEHPSPLQALVVIANTFSVLPGDGAIVNQDYYVRILPVYNGKLAGHPSNTVLLHYGFQQQPVKQTPASHLPDIYDVEILDYTYPDYALANAWGCVVILESNDPKYVPGYTYCPSNVTAKDCDGLLDEAMCLGEGVIEGASEAWDSVAGAYEWVKSEIAAAVASLINEIFPGACNQDCQDVIKTAVGYAISYVTGIPPSLPSSQELFDQGIAGAIEYGVAYSAQQIGADCDENCKAAIRALLEQAAEKMRAALKAGPGCNAEQASALGKNPFCVPAGVVFEPAPHAISRSALIGLRITRKQPQPGEPALSAADANRYRLRLTGTGINNTRIGQWLKYCAYDDTQVFEPGYNDAYMHVLSGMEGPLFAPEELAIPWLEPGESTEFLVPLKPGNFVLWKNCGAAKWAHMYLFYLGITSFEADVLCEASGGQLDYCGESEIKQFQNPFWP